MYSRRVIVEQIVEELKLTGDGVYQEFLSSCFGFLLLFDTQGVCCTTALHLLFAHEVVKADAGPGELWFRVGGRFIRFSKYEYALVTGLSFGSTAFDPCADHHPPASGLFSRHYGGRNLTMDSLRSDFIRGAFRESPSDALKVAKLLIVYFLLFGFDGTKAYIDEWAWTLIEEDTDQWETFMWGKYSYQILLTSLERVPTELPQSNIPSYRIYGFVWALLIWAFEAIPELGIACGVVLTSEDVLPRCLRWRFPKKCQLVMDGFFDRQMEVHSTLQPSAEEQRQPYWDHIHDDLRSSVRCVRPTKMKWKKKKRKRDDLRAAKGHTVGVQCGVAEADPLLPIWGAKSSRYLRSPNCHSKADARKANCSHFLKTEPESLSVDVDLSGRDKSIFELMEKINELKNKNFENERLMGVFQEKYKHFDTMVVEMGNEIKELRLKQLEADKVVEELKLKNLELNLELYDGGGNGQNFKGVKENSRSGSAAEGDRNLAQPWIRGEDEAPAVKNSRGSQSAGRNPPEAQSKDKVKDNEYKEPQASGNIATRFNGYNDEVSSDDSDDSCTDSRMDDIIASLRSKKLGRKWTREPDYMLRAFKRDEQLCMNANQSRDGPRMEDLAVLIQ